jgi:hypothetical protein
MKSRRMRWSGHIEYVVETGNSYRVLVGKPDWKRILGRPRHSWKNTIKITLRKNKV